MAFGYIQFGDMVNQSIPLNNLSGKLAHLPHPPTVLSYIYMCPWLLDFFKKYG